MQIDRIVLYKSSSEVRELAFRTGRLNVITGESRTGKTALIDIVDYCLGTTGCNIVEGIREKNVVWFAVVFQFSGEQLFVARMNPLHLNQLTTTEVYIEVGRIIDTPSFDAIKPNENISGLRNLIEGKIGISENLHTPDGYTRDPLRAGIKHARFYCFQPQYLIDQRSLLFYKQEEDFIPQAIKDSMPYFLGAVRKDSLKLEHELAEKRKTYNRLLRLKKGAEKLTFKVRDQAIDLCEEAKELGLLASERVLESSSEAIQALLEVTEWQGEDQDTSGEYETLNILIAKKKRIKQELGKLNEDIAVTEKFVDEAEGYTEEGRNQQNRLRSIGLFDPGEGRFDESEHMCPMCGSNLVSEIPGANEIDKALRKLGESLEQTTRQQPRLREYLEGLYEQQNDLKDEIRSVNRSIGAVYQQQEEIRNIRDLNIKRGKVIGRIELFIESTDFTDSKSSINHELRVLENEIEELEEKIGLEEKQERLNSILNKINLQMSRWTNLLDLEDPEAPLRFDLRKLTLFIDKDRPVPMEQMGSGANWVSYHLLIHMALHKHFVLAKRPVPNFLFLDQPSQAYYPPQYKEKPGKYKSSQDDEMVKAMYDFVNMVVEEVTPNLQVIITDHARIPEYKENIVEEWRNGKKLIPSSWYTA